MLMTSQPWLLEPLRFAAGRKPRPLDYDDRSAVERFDFERLGRFDRNRPQRRAVRVGKADVRRDRSVVERVFPPARAVDQLVGDDHRAGRHALEQRTAGRRRDDRLHAEFFHRVEICAIVDGLRRKPVIFAVPRQKRDAASGDLAECNLVARRPVRRLNPRFVRVFDQRIKPRSAEHTDIGPQIIIHTLAILA